METLTTVEHIRHHVAEDVGDLVSLLGAIEPLILSARLRDADDKAHAGRLMRRVLTRYLALVVCRLHEEPGKDTRTGEPASIDALLDIAAAQLSEFKRGAELKSKRRALIAELEADGVKFSNLRSFRTAELAHSLHRKSTETDNTISYRAISVFARKTYHLVLEIERDLAICGLTAFIDLPYLESAWERRGIALWEEL